MIQPHTPCSYTNYTHKHQVFGNRRAFCQYWYESNCQVELWQTSLGALPILVQHHVRFSMVLIPQLQLRHLHWLVFVWSVGDLHSQMPQALHIMSCKDANAIVKTHYCLSHIRQDNTTHILSSGISSFVAGTEDWEHLAILAICVTMIIQSRLTPAVHCFEHM
jgi:hypothetical protein